MTISDFSETALVGRIRARLQPDPAWLLVGIGDDAAVVEPARNRVEVITVDALVDGVHFDAAFTPPEAIGHRALAVNLSDLAAMGAAPRLALLSLALPPLLPVESFDAIATGLAALAARFGTAVVGGNLTRTPGPLTLDVTAIGTAKRRQVLTRGGARPGDELFVTGSIGAAAAGLGMLRAGQAQVGPCPERYLYPEPRVRMGSLIGRNRAASACMDLSDGLADAVHQVAEVSGVGAEIDASALPIEPSARDWFTARGEDPVEAAVTGGDDYELLVAVRPGLRRRLAAAHRHGDVPLTRIGVCTADRAIVLRDGPAVRPMPRGYSHFAR